MRHVTPQGGRGGSRSSSRAATPRGSAENGKVAVALFTSNFVDGGFGGVQSFQGYWWLHLFDTNFSMSSQNKENRRSDGTASTKIPVVHPQPLLF